MSAREKKLLSLLLIAGFLILNFFLYSFYITTAGRFTSDLQAAKARLNEAILYRESSSRLSEEMSWLAEHQPPASAYQDVQTQLQQFAETRARNLGLTINSQELLPTDESGIHFNRAQIKLNLTGNEPSLYRWFDEINDPASFRTAYQIRLSPSKDDTLIDCSATLAQWFPPTI